jgi:acyl CoA:acetate/3-ketoacid CoA transferase alpha subunit
MGGAWQINDIVAGVGGGLGMEVGAKWGRLTMRADYYRTNQVVQYQMNSFSFIVGYTNINLFSGGTWVGTYHAGGVGIGSSFTAGAAFFCQQGQDPMDCIVSV